jgi:hypothetical protein
VSGTGVTSGSVALFTGSGATLAAGGKVVEIAMGAATTGAGETITTTGVYTGTSGVWQLVANSATLGTLASVSGTGLTTGTGVLVTAAAATLTTGSYLRANDGAADVFRVGLNGHLIFAQTTAPTIAVTQQNGITAAAITAGSTDVNGIITTTGTNNNGGSTILTVTFNKTYTNAPKSVILTPANDAAAETAAHGAIPMPYVTTTATTMVITIPQFASYQATPSWMYQVMA